MPLMPEAALTDEKGGAETSAHPQRGEEPPAMIPLPTACPTCKTAGILYSVGVIRSAFPSVWREYPVVWCAHCRPTRHPGAASCPSHWRRTQGAQWRTRPAGETSTRRV